MPTFGTGYMDTALDDLGGLIAQAADDLADVDFDTLVGTGLSSAVVIPALALRMGKRFVLIRKEGDDSHHGGGRLLGNLGSRWIFVDDFVSSGHTRNRVMQKIADVNGTLQVGWDYRVNAVMRTTIETEHVGDYLYLHNKGDRWNPVGGHDHHDDFQPTTPRPTF